MALKINLKPYEALHVGTTKITVAADSNVTLLIDGDAPVLRDREYIAAPSATDDAARLQFIIQQMYLARDIAGFHEEYFRLAQKLTGNSAEMAQHIAGANSLLVQGEYYKALKLARHIVEIVSPSSDSAAKENRPDRSAFGIVTVSGRARTSGKT